MILKNFWYIAAYSAEINRELFARTFLNEPVVMYRKLDGSIAAISDRCSHRRAALSRGQLVGDHVQCSYHGLEFDSSGRCVRIPGQQDIPSSACVRAFPTVEKNGFIWIWPGDPAQADAAKVPDYFMCTSPGCAGKSYFRHVKGDYVLAVENLLDLSHLNYLHPQAFAADISRYRAQTTVEADVVTAVRTLEDVPNLSLYKKAMGIERVDRVQVASYRPGGNLRVDSIVRPTGTVDSDKTLTIYIFVQVTPETDTSHFAFTGLYRDFSVHDGALTDRMHDEFIEVVLQDVSIIEHQQANHDVDRDPPRTINLVVDQASLEARRIIRRLHEQESSSRPAAQWRLRVRETADEAHAGS